MKVVHIVTRHFGNRYGADANIVNWIEWERRHGHEVVLVAGRDSPPSGIPGIRIRLVDSLVREIAPAKDVQAFGALRRILDEERPDVVHTHHSKAGILGRLAVPRSALSLSPESSPDSARRGMTVLHTVHMASFGPAYGRSSRVFLALERLCARRTSELIAVGEELRSSYLAAGVGRDEHFHVVRSPAGVERFMATRDWSSQRRRELREAWGLPEDRSIVLAAGLLERRKRHGLLIERLAPMLAEGGTTMLVIAGDGPLREELIAQIDDAGLASAVRMVGYVHRLEELVAVADVFVHTARVEGVPQTVLQAIAAGTPVVATAVEGLAEITADVVRVVDIDGAGLAAAVGRVLDGQAAQAVATESVEPWTVAAVEGQIAELYRRIHAGGAAVRAADAS